MSELPDGWVECEIGEAVKVVGGATPSSKDPSNFTDKEGVPWITPADLSGYQEMYIERGARNLSCKGFSSCSAAMMPAGSVLFSSRAPIGYVAIAANEVSTNQGFKSFVLPEGLDSRFVYYQLKHIKQVAEMMATGTTFKELSGAAASKLPLIIAPLNEQKHIADKLDVLLKRVDTCRERLDNVPIILKRFRHSVLAAATSGALTEDWREEKDLGGWKTVSIKSVASEIFDGPFGSHLKSQDYTEKGIRVARLENIGWLHFLSEKETFISHDKFHLLRKHTLKTKDVLFSSFVSEEVRVCLLPDELSGTIINKADCFCVRTNTSICMPEFLAMRLACRTTFAAFADEIHGATRPRINLGQLKCYTFDLPSVKEQQEIVRRVEKLFAFADSLEALYTTARKQVDQLTPSLLAKAFRGELVEQDPNDEPASVLLEKIKAERAGQVATKQTRGRKQKVVG